MATFIMVGTLPQGNGSRMIIGGDAVPTDTIVNNSEVLIRGNVMEWDANGNIVGANTVGSALAGVLIDVAKNGIAVDPDSGTVNTWTMGGSNEDTDKKYANMDISPYTLYSAQLDAAAGTSTDSDTPAHYFDILTTDATQLDESTSSTTTGFPLTRPCA